MKIRRTERMIREELRRVPRHKKKIPSAKIHQINKVTRVGNTFVGLVVGEFRVLEFVKKYKSGSHCWLIENWISHEQIIRSNYDITKRCLQKIYSSMILRCYNPNHHRFKTYGARGAFVQESWLKSIWNYIKDTEYRPSMKHTRDRIDNDQWYIYGNLRWVLNFIQQLNRTDNRYLILEGLKLTVTEWERILDYPKTMINHRLYIKHWTDEEALLVPPYGYRKLAKDYRSPFDKFPILKELRERQRNGEDIYIDKNGICHSA